VIGARTVATLTLLAVEVLAAWVLGVLRPERLASRGPGTLFLIGCFGVVVGTLMFRFWRLGERSRQAFRFVTGSSPREPGEGHFVGGEKWRITTVENRGEARDLPPPAQHALCVAIALLLALGCLDARALDLLGRFHRRASESSSYCPEPEEAPKLAMLDPNAPGCELLRRAVALGYATSLGDCEPKKLAAASGAPGAVCNRRQRDEPPFHYAWRLLDDFWTRLKTNAGSGWFDRAGRDFGARASHLGALRAAERQVLASAPRASHHLWTNLPDPGDGAFEARTCADKYRSMGHRPSPLPGPDRPGRVLEHVMAQLLFESRYEPAAGYCREYHVHFGAPPDACERLAQSPQQFLAGAALGDIRSVLERRRVGQELAALGAPAQAAEPSSVVSFQCYIEGGAPARRSIAFTLDGQAFTAEELRVPASPKEAMLFVDRYDAVAGLFAKGFHYGNLLSEAGLTESSPTALGASFAGNDYLLTRLYELDSVDLYLDPAWLAGRPDLLEVYPYQRHLKNFVQTFRRQYRRERGRL
jgi:hypothetical protein